MQNSSFMEIYKNNLLLGASTNRGLNGLDVSDDFFTSPEPPAFLGAAATFLVLVLLDVYKVNRNTGCKLINYNK